MNCQIRDCYNAGHDVIALASNQYKNQIKSEEVPYALQAHLNISFYLIKVCHKTWSLSPRKSRTDIQMPRWNEYHESLFVRVRWQIKWAHESWQAFELLNHYNRNLEKMPRFRANARSTTILLQEVSEIYPLKPICTLFDRTAEIESRDKTRYALKHLADNSQVYTYSKTTKTKSFAQLSRTCGCEIL